MRILIALAALISMTGTARAEPITAIIGLVSSVISGIGAGVTAIGTSVLGATAWTAVAGFLASPFGSLLLGVGISLVSSLFVSKQKKSQQAPTTEAGKVNVRITEPERWLCCGRVRQGGGVLFGEFDAGGNFWYLVAHSDSELAEIEEIYFDDIEIFTDPDGTVQAPEFCLDPGYNLYGGTGPKVPYWNINTHTFNNVNPVPSADGNLIANFPGIWTAQHYLVGISYSVIRGSTLPIEHRHKIYKWRGPFGMGEPAVSIVGLWSKIYDPRDGTQSSSNPATWKASSNPVLIWAWFRTHRRGRDKSMSEINWTRIAEQANICDQMVTGIQGTQKRYECGIAIPDSKERAAAEQEILLSCDGQIVFDDDGKAWPRVGYYEAPSLFLSRNRDVVGMESVEAQNGESETQGVIVRYVSPQAKYSTQPAAAWDNPFYYVPGQVTKYLQVDILGCQNHNQAMRLAKAIGMRSQPEHKILPTVGLRGLQARQERIIDINYDNTFSGEYEIVTPVEVDELGAFCGLGCVPVDPDRWTLLPGEEKLAPIVTYNDAEYIVELPLSLSVAYVNGRFEANFTDAPRSDWRYKIQYSPSGSSEWSDFVVQMENNFAYTGGIAPNYDFDIRWQTVTSSGRVSAWSGPPYVIVNTSPIQFTGAFTATGTDGTPYSSAVVASGGVPAYGATLVGGALPPGLSLSIVAGNQITISGTPSSVGSYPGIVIRVTDTVGNFHDIPASITISP